MESKAFPSIVISTATIENLTAFSMAATRLQMKACCPGPKLDSCQRFWPVSSTYLTFHNATLNRISTNWTQRELSSGTRWKSQIASLWRHLNSRRRRRLLRIWHKQSKVWYRSPLPSLQPLQQFNQQPFKRKPSWNTSNCSIQTCIRSQKVSWSPLLSTVSLRKSWRRNGSFRLGGSSPRNSPKWQAKLCATKRSASRFWHRRIASRSRESKTSSLQLRRYPLVKGLRKRKALALSIQQQQVADSSSCGRESQKSQTTAATPKSPAVVIKSQKSQPQCCKKSRWVAKKKSRVSINSSTSQKIDNKVSPMWSN